ncbi:F0F1 ATP synthase subunit delta [Blochmannia endosymbiont of Camponotus (Colobopsis) obliquus]|uniref:F0F1 ATP synthase subunit delta n=1 Tax=Blochmannia endosymbiont of Camponotus (Colobopsis) obliquus TaxID=1505597 RepID=UPI00061A7417|nr:F0F1 ATP synthase subunit delta [Blochmannia endosymbiont of Camponotus (Colobopsis) obliquus]AKC60190.1 ATP synthase subunit delta [Blochmannia endosymbiont of Camponotus (Colobopsis) obliquus]
MHVVNISTIARPYAKAAFDFAVKQKRITQWRSMLTVAAKISQDKQIIKLLSSHIGTYQLSNLFITICGNQLDCYCQNFIKIMAKYSRLPILPNVLQQFIYFCDVQKNIVKIKITSACPLNKDQLTKITNIMEKKLSKTVQLMCKIDKAIIAGIMINIGNTVIDGSILNRLEHLKKSL